MVTARVDLVREQVMGALGRVPDPEIPAVSVIDLGIVESVKVDGDRVEVTCLPTFVGCPALETIRQDIERALVAIGATPFVRFVHDPPWTTSRITEEGRRKLEDYGLSPPERNPATSAPLTLLSPGRCPYCGSQDTVLESPFGPTLCRATSYCRTCRNPFEKFKQV
jgi:ring-1,2-phenylacetyl-CoA epoxidase subunit PaaD